MKETTIYKKNTAETAHFLPLNQWVEAVIKKKQDEVWFLLAASDYAAHRDGDLGKYVIQGRGTCSLIGSLHEEDCLLPVYSDYRIFEDGSFMIEANLEYGDFYYIRVASRQGECGQFCIRATAIPQPPEKN